MWPINFGTHRVYPIISGANMLTIWANPAFGFIMLSSDDADKMITVSIKDSIGSKDGIVKPDDTTFTIDIASFTNYTYMPDFSSR